MSRSDLIVGLDVGTTKVCAVVAEVTDTGVNILGIGSHPCRGLRKGVVNNIESTTASIIKALEQAEAHSGCEIHSVYVGITGWQIKSLMSHGVAALKSGKVGKREMDRVMEAASAVVIPSDREVIHVLPCEYRVDGKSQSQPLGMEGVRFEVNCHVVTSVSASVDNILECCRAAGLHVEEVVFEPLASYRSVLTEAEQQQGVAMLDMGGGTSDLVIIRNGSVVFSTVIPLGGYHMTNDIAQVLKIPADPTAEMLKLKYGMALRELTDDQLVEIRVPDEPEPRVIAKQVLAEIIENRAEEMLRLVRVEVENSGFEQDAETGIVLTGGCSLLPGIDRMAERVFRIPARTGNPIGLGGKVKDIDNPRYATGTGLVLHGAMTNRKNGSNPIAKRVRIDGMISRMKEWISGFL